MNAYELLAFVITPVALACFGWAVVLVYERRIRHKHGSAGE